MEKPEYTPPHDRKKLARIEALFHDLKVGDELIIIFYEDERGIEGIDNLVGMIKSGLLETSLKTRETLERIVERQSWVSNSLAAVQARVTSEIVPEFGAQSFEPYVLSIRKVE